MSSQEDILKAIAAERNKLLSSTVTPPPPLTAEEIVRDMQEQANAGRGQQKIAGNKNMGAPKSPVSADEVSAEQVANFWNIPGLKKKLQNDRR